MGQFLAGPYRIENVDVDVAVQLSNKSPSGTYRGPGRYEADFIRERLFDRLEAASSMSDVSAKDSPLSAVAMDAAKAGEIDIAKRALTQMYFVGDRNSAMQQIALQLAKQNRGQHLFVDLNKLGERATGTK